MKSQEHKNTRTIEIFNFQWSIFN